MRGISTVRDGKGLLWRIIGESAPKASNGFWIDKVVVLRMRKKVQSVHLICPITPSNALVCQAVYFGYLSIFCGRIELVDGKQFTVILTVARFIGAQRCRQNNKAFAGETARSGSF